MLDMLDILHVDINCFFAAVEILDNPLLQGLPVIVGGVGPRSVVSSASYEARAKGVHSAMPIYQALRYCPDSVLLPVRIARYRSFSEQFMDVLKSITPMVESVSLDEAYLDVARAHSLFGESNVIAQRIVDDIFSYTKLHCTVGVSYNKLLAKLASKAAKPKIVNGKIEYREPVLSITKDNSETFLSELPVSSLPGIGHKTLGKLTSIGIVTVADLKILSRATLVAKFGLTQGNWIFNLARGEGSSEVTPSRLRKSLAREETFDSDITSFHDLSVKVDTLAEDVYFSLKRERVTGRCVSIKIRFNSFETVTRSKTSDSHITSVAEIKAIAHELLLQVDMKSSVRLCGVSVSHLANVSDIQFVQSSLFEQEVDSGHNHKLEDTALKIKERFGSKYLRYGSTND